MARTNATIKEACQLVKIDTAALYDYQEKLHDEQEHLKSLFIGHLIHHTPGARAVELQISVIAMSSVTASMYKAGQRNILHSMRHPLVALYKQTVELIDECEVEDERKIAYKAVCWDAAGILHRLTDHNSDAIECYDKALHSMHTNMRQPQHYHVYASLHYNKGLALQEPAGKIDCFDRAKRFVNTAKDVSQERKSKWITSCEKELTKLRK